MVESFDKTAGWSHNEKARDAFLTREKNGRRLTEHVWKATGTLLSEMRMRMSIDMGIHA